MLQTTIRNSNITAGNLIPGQTVIGTANYTIIQDDINADQ